MCGDSFAADWSQQFPDQTGWPNLLADCHGVTNLAQAGCSQYRIYQQLVSQDLASYDAVIISHTSPYRIYVANHPIHSKDSLHANSDLIYSDVKEHAGNHPELQSLVDYFERWFDLEQARFMHGLLCEHMDRMVRQCGRAWLHLINLPWQDLYQFDHMIDLGSRFPVQPGLTNHYDTKTNQDIFRMVNQWVNDQFQ